MENCLGGLRNVAGHQVEPADSMLPMEVIKFSANTIAAVSYPYKHYTEELGERDKQVAKRFGVIRRGKKSEATDGTQRRMAAMTAGAGNLGNWRLVSIEVNQLERYDGFADMLASTVFSRSTEKVASQRHQEQRHQKSTTNLGACFHTDMDESIRAHTPEKLSQSVFSYGYCSERILEQGEPHDFGRSFVAMKYS